MAGLPTDEIPALKEVEQESTTPEAETSGISPEEDAAITEKSAETAATGEDSSKKPSNDAGILMVETINLYNEPYENTPEIKVVLKILKTN